MLGQLQNTRRTLHYHRWTIVLLFGFLFYPLWHHSLERWAFRQPWFQQAMGYAPYSHVEINEDRIHGKWRYVTFSFEKGDCDRKNVRFIGEFEGLRQFVKWQGLDGVEESHNRSPGWHTVRGRLFVDDIDYDWIEIRTEHQCADRIIRRIMFRLTPNTRTDQ